MAATGRKKLRAKVTVQRHKTAVSAKKLLADTANMADSQNAG